ncbi:MAG: helix-turn-helix transcriptional regulator [Chloroflexi bacterium]|nr:helix-turn-helix transcriptional regulator [Chloroflexota bacterium]
MEAQPTFGEYLNRQRRRKRWTLASAAEAAGLSPTHLSRLENDSQVPSAETVVRLAQALEGDLDTMLELAACLPSEILDRYIRRAHRSDALRRGITPEDRDTGYPAALVDDMDDSIRRAISRRFGLPEDDASGLFAVLQRLATSSPDERAAVLRFLAPGGDVR